MSGQTAPISDPSLLPPPGTRARALTIAVLMLAPVAFGALALFLGPDANWDLRNYHWYNAYAWLTGRTARGTDFMPSQGQFFFNPLADVPFYWLATHVPLRVAGFILGAVQGLNFPLVFMLAYRCLVIPDPLRKTAACCALAALGTLSAMGISEIGAVFQDNTTSLGILLSALLVLWRLDYLLTAPRAKAVMRALLCGIPAGLAAGLKLTCISYCLGLCIALLVITVDMRRCVLLSFFFGLGVLAGFAATDGAWAWHLYSQYGSPVFPLFNAIFRSPLLPPHILLTYPPPHGFRLLFYPFFFGFNPYLVNEIWWRDERIPVLYALFLLLAVFKFLKKKDASAQCEEFAQGLPARFLLIMTGVSYFFWLFTESVYRYLLTLDMMAPLLIVLCIGLLPGTLRLRARLAAYVLAFIALTIQPGNWGRWSAWPDKLVSITRPELSDKGDLMMLMAGTDAYAYLLPAFPPDISFVRLQSRGFFPEQNTGITHLIRERIDANKGKFMLFMPSQQLAAGKAALAYYGLAVSGTCGEITDNRREETYSKHAEGGDNYPAKYSLCDVRRLKNSHN